MNGIAELENADRRLVLATQAGLPLVERPFAAIADATGLPVAEVMDRLVRLQRLGVIRRIAAIPNHYRLGYLANAMTVWNVGDDMADAIGRRIADWPGVSHCYRRPRQMPLWPFNLFAMLHGRDRSTVEAEVAALAAALHPHVREHAMLFSTRILKKTGLRLAGAPPEAASP
ncbi:MAG: Lrp/AsnC family transcriptional regulator [Rhodospirillaceae bacterium]